MKREEKEQRERERARKKSSREGQNKEETIMRMIKENYMFLLSVVLLSLALLLKVVYLWEFSCDKVHCLQNWYKNLKTFTALFSTHAVNVGWSADSLAL